MSKRVAITLAFLLILMVNNDVFADDVDNLKNEAEILQRLVLLEEKKNLPPPESIAQAERMRAISDDKNWQNAYILASLIQIELLLSTDNITKASLIYDEVSNNPLILTDEELTIRFQIVDMQIRQSSGNLEDAPSVYADLLEKAVAQDDLALSGKIYMAVGLSQYIDGLYVDAIQSYILAYGAYELANVTDNQAKILTTIGNIYADQEQNNEAIEYFEKAIRLSEQTDDKLLQATLYFNIGLALKNNEKFLDAKRNMLISEALSEEIGDDLGKIYATLGIAFIELELEEWSSALALFKSALPFVVESGNQRLQLDTQLGITKSYANLQDFANAEKTLVKSKALLNGLNGNVVQLNYLKVAIDVYAEQDRYKEAFSLLREKSELENAMNKEMKEKELQSFQVKYDTELTEKRNENLLIQNQLQALKISEHEEREKLRNTVITLVILLLLLVLVFLVFQIKNRNHFKVMASRDFLTNAPNRRAVIEYATVLFDEAIKNDMPLFIAIVDFDHFKALNDTYGHDAGDNVLRSFAKACTEALRKEDGFGRYGGEEWLLVLPGIEGKQVEAIFERLKKAMNELDINGIPPRKNITFSMGAAAIDVEKDKNLTDIIARADQLLYMAKEQGKNRLVLRSTYFEV